MRAKAYLKDPDLRRARAIQMLALRVKGFSVREIAAQYKVHPITVERTLTYAKQARLMADYEDQILRELVPEAITAFKTALQGGDTQVALEVFKGMGLMLKPNERAKVAPDTASAADDLDAYIHTLRGGIDVPAIVASAIPSKGLPAHTPVDGPEVVEAEMVERGRESANTGPSEGPDTNPVALEGDR